MLVIFTTCWKKTTNYFWKINCKPRSTITWNCGESNAKHKATHSLTPALCSYIHLAFHRWWSCVCQPCKFGPTFSSPAFSVPAFSVAPPQQTCLI